MGITDTYDADTYDEDDWDEDDLDEEEYDSEDEVIIVKQDPATPITSIEQDSLRKDLEKKCKRPVVILPPGVSLDFVKLDED